MSQLYLCKDKRVYCIDPIIYYAYNILIVAQLLTKRGELNYICNYITYFNTALYSCF